MPENQLAAFVGEGGEVGVGRIEQGMAGAQAIEGLGVEAQLLQPIARLRCLFEHQIAQCLEGDGFAEQRAMRAFGHEHAAPCELRAGLRTADGQSLTGTLVARPVIYAPCRLHLCGSQALVAVLASGALDRGRVESTDSWVAEQPVELAIQAVTLFKHGSVQKRQL